MNPVILTLFFIIIPKPETVTCSRIRAICEVILKLTEIYKISEVGVIWYMIKTIMTTLIVIIFGNYYY